MSSNFFSVVSSGTIGAEGSIPSSKKLLGNTKIDS